MYITPCWNDEGGVRILRTTRLVNIKTETTFAGQIGDGDLMNYRSCVVNSLTRHISNS